MGPKEKNESLEREIGIRIMTLRGNETQEALAKSVGVSRVVVENWERGTRHIKSFHLVALAKHFGVSTDYLLGLSPSQNPDLHFFTEKTGFSNLAVQSLYLISGHGRNNLPTKRNRKAFEELLLSKQFNNLLSCLVNFLDTTSISKSNLTNLDSYIALDDAVSKQTNGSLRVVQSGLLAQTFKTQAQIAIQNSFDAIALSVGDDWQNYLPKEKTTPGDNNTESGN